MRIIRLCSIVLLFVLSVGLVAGAPRGAAHLVDATCAPEGCKTFVPTAGFDLIPRMSYPGNGEAITSLAPTLLWNPTTLGSYLVQVSSNGLFDPISTIVVSATKDISKPVTDQVGTLVTSNLKASTVYYWRVGVETPSGYVFAQQQFFSTPAADAGVLPPVVTVTDPRNNSSMRRDSVLLKWKAVPGALLYRLRMVDGSGRTFSSGTAYVDGKESTFWVYNLQPGQKYTWKIKAYNQFGWGSYTDDQVFNIQ
ncbi:MAG TPA: fibronectin type III domain-containing protein [Kouleothrix sp.]|uniref:hypothetical protein n=1 Tax=Kouleothrix sp. TaxID=2779161 RepID=UPI002C237CFA|nr:fibronectin type III domain-containing protein [Kouleothrix sp.]HRC74949.1 fibronectin type III domain-containing protein [Kouleothrix sp.]